MCACVFLFYDYCYEFRACLFSLLELQDFMKQKEKNSSHTQQLSTLISL